VSLIRLGIIGLSDGNGHPYSWSAICNGYDAAAMAECPFPAIPAYLAQRRFPEEAIAEARVTHIWTQDRLLSEHIAKAALIDTVVDRTTEMIGHVDAILLARDDAKNHSIHAAPFLEAGLPIYVDKPLALSVADAMALHARQRRPGQIFTCSALAYAAEFQATTAEMTALGPLRKVEAMTIKDWDRYAVHVIEPLLALVGKDSIVATRASGDHTRHLDVEWRSGLTGRITALGTQDGQISITLTGENARREMVFRDTFSAFRAALRHFVDIVLGKAPPQNTAAVLEVVRLIEAGRAE